LQNIDVTRKIFVSDINNRNRIKRKSFAVDRKSLSGRKNIVATEEVNSNIMYYFKDYFKEITTSFILLSTRKKL
jgi:hypothetical protein